MMPILVDPTGQTGLVTKTKAPAVNETTAPGPKTYSIAIVTGRFQGSAFKSQLTVIRCTRRSIQGRLASRSTASICPSRSCSLAGIAAASATCAFSALARSACARSASSSACT